MPIIELDMSQVQAYQKSLDRAIPNAKRVMQDMLREAAPEVLEELKAAWRPHEYTGMSGQALVIDQSGIEQLYVDVGFTQASMPMDHGFPYPLAIEYGSRPHTPPFQRIAQWAAFRNKAEFAYVIWRKIREEGTKAYHVFGGVAASPELMDRIEKVVAKLLNRIGF